ncbi:hypothetical protein MASR1M68_13010 [Elusimicrobiota bacterium]
MLDLRYEKKTTQEQDFINNKVLKNKCKLALYGSDVFLNIMFKYLTSKNIKVEAFYPFQSGQIHENLKKISSEEIKDYTVVICCENEFLPQAKKNISNLKCKSFIFYFDFFLDLKKLSRTDYKKYFPVTFWAVYNLSLNYKFTGRSINKILPTVEFVITEKCTLKCKNCANLMQYYKNPQDENFKLQTKALKNLLKSVDKVLLLRIIGGEPLLNKQLCAYINAIYKSSVKNKILVCDIVTNGTIVPDKELVGCMKKYSIVLTASDYGVKSNKFQKILEQSKKEKYFLSLSSEKWTACNKISEKYEKNMIPSYINCFMKRFNTIKDGQFFICPFSAHSKALKAVDKKDVEAVDLTNNRNIMSDIIAQKKKAFLKVCRYCHIEHKKIEFVKPALQIKKPLGYKVFE